MLAFGEKMKSITPSLTLVWATIILTLSPCLVLADQSPSLRPNYAQPLFTQRGIPVCDSRDDLQTLLSLVRSGRIELLDQVHGCRPFPIDGVVVIVLDSEGIVDVWMRVRLMMRDGTQPIVWTAGWMLRNDDSPTIAGDPSAGKIKICETKDFGKVDVTWASDVLVTQNVHVPALAIFENAGLLVGDLQGYWVNGSIRPETANDHAALVTTQAADLTKERPCAEVSARMFMRDGNTVKTWPASSDNVWNFDHVLGRKSVKLALPGRLTPTLAPIREVFGLRAVVTADVGNPLTISEEEAASNWPENRLNRLPAELQLAREAAPNGPDGKGNFKVCLWEDADEVSDDKAESVTVPPNVIFESAGRLIGDLRRPEPDIEYGLFDNITSWAVITLKSVTLSKWTPCAVIPVRSVLSNSWPWRFPLVRASDHLHFQALKLKGREGNEGLPGHLGDALFAGALNGTPLADIGRTLDLGDERP
jgi:hypothetical protein